VGGGERSLCRNRAAMHTSFTVMEFDIICLKGYTWGDNDCTLAKYPLNNFKKTESRQTRNQTGMGEISAGFICDTFLDSW
jgi:hypothetical protein